MGGGGTHYDRDTTSRAHRTHMGTSQISEAFFEERRSLDRSLLPKGRRFVCEAKSPVVLAFDVTGSMGNLPKILWDKLPMIVGQIVECGYLADVKISASAIGDFMSDRAPIQIADFCEPRDLDSWLKKIWIEGLGGGQSVESYEVTAYAYAFLAEFPNAETPFCIITGDEGFRETEYLGGQFLNKIFGDERERTNAAAIFQHLLDKFKGNVFLVHRHYNVQNAPLTDEQIVKQWEDTLGKARVVILPEDLAIADIILGIFALMTGKRTLQEYSVDMRQRGQDEDRIRKVTKALETILPLVPDKAKLATVKPPARKPKKARPKKPVEPSADASADDDSWQW